MITAFGKFLRILRMDNGEILKTMAEKTGGYIFFSFSSRER